MERLRTPTSPPVIESADCDCAWGHCHLTMPCDWRGGPGGVCKRESGRTYRCLSCYKESPVSEWGDRGMKCPLCGHVYDDHCVMQAQDRC